MAGFMRATMKALRFVKKNRAATVKAIVDFSGLKPELAERTYDDIIPTFTENGVVDEETQNNDLEIVAQVVKVKQPVPNERAYDFSFASKAAEELTKANWKP